MPLCSADTTLSYLTVDLAGVGGVIKKRPADFMVEEIPLYEPVGQGEHLHLLIEKRSRTTSDAVRHLARCFRVGRKDIGYAGLKDKHAVTRQYFSIHLPGLKSEDEQNALSRVDNETLRVVHFARHLNKLRRGHLHGNRFDIRLRDAAPNTLEAVKQILHRLDQTGVPNFLGEQRFGYRQNNDVMGRLLLKQCWLKFLDVMLGQPTPDGSQHTDAGRAAYEQGDYDEALKLWPRRLHSDRQALDALRQGKAARDAVMMINADQRRFLLSGLQSAIFNRLLDQRLRAGSFDRLLVGDLAVKHDNRALFAVDQAIAQTENAPGGRIHTREISPTGPMWGAQMPQTAGEVLQHELDVLHEFDLEFEDFSAEAPDHLAPKGERRSLRIFLKNAQAHADEDELGAHLRLTFDLPRGAFATVVLREIMKTEGPEES